MNDEKVARVEAWVRENMLSDGGAHDWLHVDRVRLLAEAMARTEGARMELTLLCALLHDISDYKLNGGDRTKAAAMARQRLTEDRFDAQTVDLVSDYLTVSGFSQSASQDRSQWPLEWKIVQDADYLDALGAVGVARVFWFAGHRGEPIYSDPELPPVGEWSDRVKRTRSTLAHFEKKLLRLHDSMLTSSGRALGEARHKRMLDFVNGLVEEWNCHDVAKLEQS